MSLEFTFPAVAGGGKITGSTFERTIPMGGSLVVETEGAGGVQAGWAQMETTGSLGGFAIFRSGTQEAVVPMKTRVAGSSILWYDHTEGFVASMAIVKPAGAAGSTDVIIRDESGAVIANDRVDLPARGHNATELFRHFPQTASGRGSIEFVPRQGGQATVPGLRFNATSFTTISVLPKSTPAP